MKGRVTEWIDRGYTTMFHSIIEEKHEYAALRGTNKHMYNVPPVTISVNEQLPRKTRAMSTA